jgi:hypothetical protein
VPEPARISLVSSSVVLTLPPAQLKALVHEKKQETNYVGNAVDAVFGLPDEGLNLPQTWMKRASGTVLSSAWWLEAMQVKVRLGVGRGMARTCLQVK